MWVGTAASTLINQFNRILNSPLGLNGDHLAKAVKMVEEEGTRTLTDEAAEGATFLMKTGDEPLARAMYDTFSEDVVEKGLQNITVLARRGFTELSDEATRGVTVAVKAAGPNPALVREFVEGTAVTADRAEKAFKNLNKLDGVDGLDDMVAFLRNNRNNATGINGAIYESTVARRIAEGEVPGTGTLRRISNDGLPNANCIDTTTDVWAMQVKHKTADVAFVPSDVCGAGLCGREYLESLKTQAINTMLQPMLVTNRPINQGLQDLLAELQIAWRQIAD